MFSCVAFVVVDIHRLLLFLSDIWWARSFIMLQSFDKFYIAPWKYARLCDTQFACLCVRVCVRARVLAVYCGLVSHNLFRILCSNIVIVILMYLMFIRSSCTTSSTEAASATDVCCTAAKYTATGSFWNIPTVRNRLLRKWQDIVLDVEELMVLSESFQLRGLSNVKLVGGPYNVVLTNLQMGK